MDIRVILLFLVIVLTVLFVLFGKSRIFSPNSIEPLEETSENVIPRYNPDNFDLTYHELTPYGDIYDTKMKEITVLDKEGQMMVLPYAPSQDLPVYYDPATTKKKEVKSFVPSYTESVLLSNASTPPPSTTTSKSVSNPHSYNFSISVHHSS